jgi:hypothetical protein
LLVADALFGARRRYASIDVRAVDETGKPDPTPAERTLGLVNRRDAVVGFGASESGSSF